MYQVTNIYNVDNITIESDNFRFDLQLSKKANTNDCKELVLDLLSYIEEDFIYSKEGIRDLYKTIFQVKHHQGLIF